MKQEFDINDLARQYDLDAACMVTQTQPARWRASWPQAGVVKPCSRVGGLAYDLVNVVRGAIYHNLQRMLGQTNPIANSLLRGLTDADVLALLQAEKPTVAGDVVLGDGTYTYSVRLDSEYLRDVRSRLMRVPR